MTPIVFVHGLAGDHRAFRRDAEALAPRFEVIRYDLIGHGRDERGRPCRFELDALADQLAAVVAGASSRPVHLCSLSYGCYVIAAFLERHPDLVETICLVGGHLDGPSPLRDVFTHLYATQDEGDWVARYAAAINPVPDEEHGGRLAAVVSREKFLRTARSLHPEVLVASLRHRLEYPIGERLRAHPVPTLWVMGEFDQLYKSSLGDLATAVPHAEYRELAGVGHAANLFDHAAFVEAYSAFLQKRSANRPTLPT